MIVVNPSDETHIVKIIPRFYPSTTIVLSLFNETLQTSVNVTNTYEIVDGILSITFDYDFVEGSNFQVKITENGNIVYRGKLFATSQTPQDYKLTANAYYY